MLEGREDRNTRCTLSLSFINSCTFIIKLPICLLFKTNNLSPSNPLSYGDKNDLKDLEKFHMTRDIDTGIFSLVI